MQLWYIKLDLGLVIAKLLRNHVTLMFWDSKAQLKLLDMTYLYDLNSL